MVIGDRHNTTLFDLLTQPAFRVWRHLFFVAAFFPIGLSQAFFVFDSYLEIETRTIYAFGIALSVTIIAFVYFNIYFIASTFLPKAEYATYFVGLITSVCAFLLLKYSVEYWIFSNAGIYRELNHVTFLDGLSNLALYSICIASGSISLLFKRWIADHELIEDLENKQLKNSIDEIKNRMQPSFLFATLSYASQRMKTEPKNASDTLFRLSELLRYQLYDSKRRQVLLESDIEFIRNFMRLEQQNRCGKLSYSVSIQGNTNKLISPAMFISWIEKITTQHPDEIHISFGVEQNHIDFECKVVGIDLLLCDFSAIEQKLKALYGDDISVAITSNKLELDWEIC